MFTGSSPPAESEMGASLLADDISKAWFPVLRHVWVAEDTCQRDRKRVSICKFSEVNASKKREVRCVVRYWLEHIVSSLAALSFPRQAFQRGRDCRPGDTVLG